MTHRDGTLGHGSEGGRLYGSRGTASHAGIMTEAPLIKGRVVVGVDGSSDATEALRVAAEEAASPDCCWVR
jgi:hypothetical protein